jgi:hypothetical protein
MRWTGLELFDKEVIPPPNFRPVNNVDASQLCAGLPPCLDAILDLLLLPSK